MQFRQIVFATILTLIIVFGPSLALAQKSLSSTNYSLDSIVFGTNFALSTNQDSVPPAISSEGPSIIELDYNKAVVFWKTDKKASSTVKFGKTTALGTESGSSDFVTDHTVTLIGLDPETTYYYKVSSSDQFGAKGESTVKSFITLTQATISSIKVSDITNTSALLSWITGSFSSSIVDYGTNTSYGSTIDSLSRSYTTDHTYKLSDLKPGTEYHFRIKATDEKGSVVTSNDFIFNTIALPTFDNISVATNGPNESIVSWTNNVPTSGVINFRATKDNNDKSLTDLTAGDSNYTVNHKVSLKNLFGNTPYRYEITATDQQGKQAKSGVRNFTTATDNIPPKIDDLKVAVTRSGDILVLTASWKTDEPAKDKATYGQKSQTNSQIQLPETSSLITNHSYLASNLNASTPYVFTAYSTDASGNTAKAEISFVTPGLSKSIITLLLETLRRTFGWVLNITR